MTEEIQVSSIEELSREIQSMRHGEWIFRGQSDAAWPLESSFVRFADRITRLRCGAEPLTGGGKLKWHRLLRTLEHDAYAKFRDQLASRSVGSQPTSMMGGLAEMQHFGCPTRLLDFSLLPYIGLFFALEAGENDFALFAIRRSDLIRFEDAGVDEGSLWTEEGTESPSVYLFTPDYSNERIARQKGVFLVPSSTVLKFHEIAESAGTRITKYVIKAALRPEALAYLARMNVAPAAVYPEVEGQIRSLAWEIQAQVLTCPL